MAMYKREKFLKLLRPYYDSEQIKVLTGLRRCGKSTILHQIIEELSATISADRIFYMDFEDFDSEIYHDDPHAFYDLIKSFASGKEKCYIFLDEVQYLDKFEMVVASARSKLDCSIFITGSTSTLLAGALASRLTGRVIEVRVMPFSYSEVAQYTGKDDENTFLDYLANGGLPLRFNETSISPVQTATTLYKGILSRDILKQHDLKSRHQFENFTSFVLAGSGETISTASINGYLQAENEATTSTTLYNYLEYLENAFLVTKCSRFDIKGKQMLSTRMKYYAIDPAFITIQKGNKDINQGLVLETIVFNELLSRGYDIYIGKTYKGEIDFVVSNGTGHCYIQVCFLLVNDEVTAREFSAFSTVKDNYPKYVISLDTVDMSRRGIRHLNIRKFLLEPELLSFN